jgi:hypothetical protein
LVGFASGQRIPELRFSATLGEEPEVEDKLSRLKLCARLTESGAKKLFHHDASDRQTLSASAALASLRRTSSSIIAQHETSTKGLDSSG